MTHPIPTDRILERRTSGEIIVDAMVAPFAGLIDRLHDNNTRAYADLMRRAGQACERNGVK